ncbi:MAG: NAD(P)/FAD-dependent oxidoreductase [Deltaproteobacteria bacterium]|nr:NAD(P)/FAD-dependent oxidoreductase [Deltaproteobacteria bacterium]
MKQKKSKTIVIGGGAAGLMAAGRAAECGAQVLLLEKMSQTGRKIGISGKGRCNLTNNAPLPEFLSHFGRNGKFLRQCFNHFFTDSLIAFFEDKGLPLVIERGGRIFPKSGKALDVVRTLNSWLNRQNVTVKKESPVTSIIVQDNKVTGVICNGEKLSCDNIILATGGKSYPRTGSTGDGYRLAAESGHTLTPIRPALVPLECKNKKITQLAGLNLKNITVRLYINGKRKNQELGEVIFTGTGISGPVVLTMSSTVVDYLNKGERVSLSIDLKPGLDDKQLANRLIRDFESRGGEVVSSLLRGLIPYQLVDVCLNSCGIPADINTRNFPAKTRKRLASWLKDFRLDISGYRGFNEAIITAGGVSLNEIEPKTMASKYVRGLYIVGELLDIQGDTGGYNLQAAFSTGRLAGSSLNSAEGRR